jgi:ribonuclease P protein component
MLGSREITPVIKKGRKVVNPEFVIFYSLSQLKNCRFGISIPHKLVKGAVQRNYYKRQIKNILASHKSFCQDSPSHYNLMIIIRPGFLVSQFSARQDSLVELLGSVVQKESKLSQSVNKELIYA